MESILKSLGLTICISFVVALATTLFGINFWSAFALIFVLHFVVFGIIHYFTGIVVNYKMRIVENEQLKLLRHQSVEVNCSSCGKPTVVPILLGQDELYKCDGCGLENKVIITAETVIPTSMVETTDPDELIQSKIKKELDVPKDIK
jgi:hypothetical protein